MPSPFPGMNPYLEHDDVWHDFHCHFSVRCSEAIVSQVQPAFIVRLGQHVYLHEIPYELRQPGLAAVDIERESFIEIRDRVSQDLVTIVDILSHPNKRPGPHREGHLAARKGLLSGPVHLVELDLLREQPRFPLGNLPYCEYYGLVNRSHKRPNAEIWPIRLREPLPVIPIPLRPGEPDARLDLQAVLHHVYDGAGYEHYIYDTDPQPPLSPDDAAWARQFVPPH
jgi:hypothetical protein